MGMKRPAPPCPIPGCNGRKMKRLYVRYGPHGLTGVGWRCPKCGWMVGDKK